MASLFGILGIANEALEAQQAAISVTSNNVANVNTPGYSREVTELAEMAPSLGAVPGATGGVDVEGVQSVRDSVLNYQVNQETQTQSQLSAFTGQLSSVQSLFAASGGSGLDTAIDSFFNSLQQLSTDPTSSTDAAAVISAAQSMVQAFQQTSSTITQQQSGADAGVVQDVTQVNSLLQQIAGLNSQIGSAQASGQDDGALEDQRDTLLSNLSQLISFDQVDAGNGQITLTTANGQALVDGTQAATLTTSMTAAGVHDIYDGGTDITSSITGGAIGGLIQARDQTIPDTLNQLNALATGIITAINNQNAQGTTPGGATGGNLFTPAGANAAADMSLATTNPDDIATSADGSAGDNGNVLAMANLQQQNIVNGTTADGAYADLVSSLGNTISSANAQQQASTTLLTQLQNQQSSVSGVSLDQESINLQQFEQAYQAAAQVVEVINSLASVTVDMATTT